MASPQHINLPVPPLHRPLLCARRDERHNASDRQSRLERLRHVADHQPEEDGRRPHPRDPERQRVVHHAPLTVGEPARLTRGNPQHRSLISSPSSRTAPHPPSTLKSRRNNHGAPPHEPNPVRPARTRREHLSLRCGIRAQATNAPSKTALGPSTLGGLEHTWSATHVARPSSARLHPTPPAASCVGLCSHRLEPAHKFTFLKTADTCVAGQNLSGQRVRCPGACKHGVCAGKRVRATNARARCMHVVRVRARRARARRVWRRGCVGRVRAKRVALASPRVLRQHPFGTEPQIWDRCGSHAPGDPAKHCRTSPPPCPPAPCPLSCFRDSSTRVSTRIGPDTGKRNPRTPPATCKLIQTPGAA